MMSLMPTAMPRSGPALCARGLSSRQTKAPMVFSCAWLLPATARAPHPPKARRHRCGAGGRRARSWGLPVHERRQVTDGPRHGASVTPITIKPVAHALRLLHAAPAGTTRTQLTPHTHRGRPDRPAAADPLRQCRAAHLPFAARSFRQRARGAGAAARSGAARRRRAIRADLQRGGRARRDSPRRKGSASAWSRPAKPAIRRGWRRSTTRRRCSACAARCATS